MRFAFVVMALFGCQLLAGSVNAQSNLPSNICVDSDYTQGKAPGPDTYFEILQYKRKKPSIPQQQQLYYGCTEVRSDRLLATEYFKGVLADAQDKRAAARWVLCKAPDLLMMDAGYSAEVFSALGKQVLSNDLRKMLKKRPKQEWSALADECDPEKVDQTAQRAFASSMENALRMNLFNVMETCRIAGGIDAARSYSQSSGSTQSERFLEDAKRMIRSACSSKGVDDPARWSELQKDTIDKRNPDPQSYRDDTRAVTAARVYLLNSNQVTNQLFYGAGGFVDRCPEHAAMHVRRIGNTTFTCSSTGVQEIIFFDLEGRPVQRDVQPILDMLPGTKRFLQEFFSAYHKERAQVTSQCLNRVRNTVGYSMQQRLATDFNNDATMFQFRCIGKEQLVCLQRYEIEQRGTVRAVPAPDSCNH